VRTKRVVGTGAVAYVRTVRTASGRGRCRLCMLAARRSIEHLGSARDDEGGRRSRPRRVSGWLAGRASSTWVLPGGWARAGRDAAVAHRRLANVHLWDGPAAAYDTLGFDEAADHDEVFGHLVLARVVESTGKQDSLPNRRAGCRSVG